MLRRLTFAFPGNLALPTGGYAYDRRLVAELRRLGWAVELLRLADAYPFPTAEDRAAAQRAFAALPDAGLVMVDGLAFGAMPEIAARHGRRLRLAALVHHPLAFETGLGRAEATGLRACEREALAHAGAVIATSRATARQLAADYGVDASRLSVGEPGTDRIGRAQGSGHPPLIVSLGTLTQRKGHDLLIEALARLAHLDWQCRIAGDSERDPKWSAFLRSRAVELGLDGRVAFAGVVVDAHTEVLAADIFALPTRYEGYGMAFAEALVCGLPIVGCAAGAVVDLVPKDAGLLVPVDDIAALAEALRTLITQPEIRGRMAAAAFAAGKRLPSWADTGRAVAAALDAMPRP